MANFNELYSKVRDAQVLSLFECTDDMDYDDIEFMESCEDLYMEGRYVAPTPKSKPYSKQTQDSMKINMGQRESSTHPGMTNKQVSDYVKYWSDVCDKQDEAARRAKAKADAGKLAAAITLVAAAAIAAGKAIAGRSKNKAIEKKVASLEKEIETLKKAEANGELSPNDVKAEIDKINNEIKSLVNQAKSETPVKESVDDLKLAIYESEMYGEITTDERDILLGMID